MSDDLKQPIPRVDRANRKTLAKALTVRGILPENELEELRAQCSVFNSTLSIVPITPAVVDVYSTESHPVIPEIASASMSSVQITPISEPVSKKTSTKIIVSPTEVAQQGQMVNLCRNRVPYSVNFDSWRVPKYSGSTDIREFFVRLEEISRARCYPVNELGTALPEFLEGRALMFYRVTFDERNSWCQLKQTFLKRFDTPEADSTRRLEILTASQQPLESAGDFICRVTLLNQSLESPLRLGDVLKALKRGLHERYANVLVARRPTTIQDLDEVCTELESVTVSPPIHSSQFYHSNRKPPVRTVTVPFSNSSSLKCFNCGKAGHMARHCFAKKKIQDKKPDPSPTSSRMQPPFRKFIPDLTKPPPTLAQTKNG